MTDILKLTKRKPETSFQVINENAHSEEFLPGKIYLYTNTGLVLTWNIAMKLFVLDSDQLQKEIEVEFNRKEGVI